MEDSRGQNLRNACVLTRHRKYMEMEQTMKQEELISREALLVSVRAALRFAELKGEALTTAVLKSVIASIEAQKTIAVVNPTQMIFYTGERE